MKSNKTSLIIGIVNTILILVLLAYIVIVNVSSSKLSDGVSVEARKYTQADADQAMEDAEYNMSSIYSMLISGSTGEIGDYSMNFGVDGSYSGFYDTDNYDVSDCTYRVVNASDNDSSDVVANVNIYNADNTGYVQYKLMFDNVSNLELYYPESDLVVQLR
jgi:hypothetical protein